LIYLHTVFIIALSDEIKTFIILKTYCRYYWGIVLDYCAMKKTISHSE